TNIAPGKGGALRDPWTLGSHAMAGGTEAMLRHCLPVKVAINGCRVDVEVKADNVGHRVPTGFIDRHLILIVIAFDAAGQAVPLVSGPRLSAAAFDHEGQAGKVYAKQFKNTI